MTDPTARSLIQRLTSVLDDRLDYEERAYPDEGVMPLINEARAYLTCWGNRTLEPILLTERQPTEVDCDAEGMCWWWHPESYERNACWCYSRGSGVESLWLPYWALPIPERVSDD